jgi:tetratricopeptide (TPR) repeat protein
MKTLLHLAGILLISLGSTQAESRNDSFQKANALYEHGDFPAAITAYEHLLSDGKPQVGVLQNLGSAYYRQGQYGPAILSFERALLLEPGNPSVKANLKLAKEHVSTPAEPARPAWQQGFYFLSRKEWAALSLLTVVFIPCICFYLSFIGSRSKAVRYSAKGALAFCAIAFMLSLAALRLRSAEDRAAIVLKKETPILLSPFSTAETRGKLPEGKSVILLKQHGDYFYTRDEATHEEGWVAATDVEPILKQAALASIKQG